MNCKKTKRTLVRQCDSWYYRVSRKHKLLEKKTDHNAHSVYLMYYHLIMVVKYRRKVIDNPISERARKKPFGVRVSALLIAGGALVEVIHQDIETQGGKKY